MRSCYWCIPKIEWNNDEGKLSPNPSTARFLKLGYNWMFQQDKKTVKTGFGRNTALFLPKPVFGRNINVWNDLPKGATSTLFIINLLCLKTSEPTNEPVLTRRVVRYSAGIMPEAW